ncbi:MAG TPA: hypothetical protein DCS97_14565 [Planctomycetes bacterium]|nr:hypothetical protein [Planctomycetota bacterium]
MKSMTGFGEGFCQGPLGMARAAIASVNHKTLSVQVRGDLRDLALEEQVRERVRASLGRGSASVQLAWEPAAGATWDRERVAAAWRELAALAAELGAPMPTLAEALAVAGRRSEDTLAVAPMLLAAVEEALLRLDAARKREGQSLSEAMRGLAVRMRKLHLRMTALAGARLPLVRERLAAVVAEAVGRSVPPEVLAREVAIEAQRIDIAEELTRIAAHLDALDRLLVKAEPVGRELDFLAQELGREANTAGAKANDAALSEHCIALKVAVDQLKEQSANVM